MSNPKHNSDLAQDLKRLRSDPFASTGAKKVMEKVLKERAKHNAIEKKKRDEFKHIPKYPIGYDKDSVPNAIKRGNTRRMMEKNNRTAMEIDEHNRSWNGKKYTK